MRLLPTWEREITNIDAKGDQSSRTQEVYPISNHLNAEICYNREVKHIRSISKAKKLVEFVMKHTILHISLDITIRHSQTGQIIETASGLVPLNSDPIFLW